MYKSTKIGYNIHRKIEKDIMNKIHEIIEAECTDEKPSDCEWSLRKEDIPVIVENIKKALIEEIEEYATRVDVAVKLIKDL